MANMSGFTPVRHNTGSPYNGQVVAFPHLVGDGSIVQIGDLVIHATTSGGTVGLNVSGMDIEGMMGCARAAASTTGLNLIGVCVGFLADQILPLREAIASTVRMILVETSPDVIYEGREDGVTTSLVATQLGLNVAYSTTAGDTTTKRSGMEIISATTAPATTSTLPLRLIGLTKRPGNSFVTSPAKAQFDVMLNTSLYALNNTAT